MKEINFSREECTDNRSALKEIYQALYDLVEADPEDHFIFTSSAAEAVNHVILAAYLDITRKTGKNHFLCSVLDEAPAVLAMTRLQELGCVFQMIPADAQGRVTKQALADLITPRTAFVSLSWANGLTGVLQPAAELAALCKERDIRFHVEASHVLESDYSSFSSSGADFLSFGIYGIPGGGLFISKDSEISPLILGGNEQASLRGGVFSFSDLCVFAERAKQIKERRDYFCTEVVRLRHLFEEKMVGSIQGSKVLFQEEDRISSISSILFPGVLGESLLYMLKRKGILATYGGNHHQHLMHLLRAAGIEEPLARCGLSFLFSYDTTEEHVKQAVVRTAEAVATLRKQTKVIEGTFT